MTEKYIYWTVTHIAQIPFLFAMTESGLCFIDTSDEPLAKFEKWTKKHAQKAILLEDDEKLAPYVDEFTRYFSGELTEFTLPLDLSGTPFQQSVWTELRKIPYGHTVSYSHVAEKIKKPTAVRAVANAIGRNPVLIINPCHRVLGKDGSLTGFSSGLDLKKTLLSLEEK